MGEIAVRARVARILDEEQVAVNVGEDAGVEVGDRVYVLRETDIPDPDNPAESLGVAFVKKGTMVIDSVAERFAVARVLRKSKTLLSPIEPTFLITEDEELDGRGRVYIQAGDPVDVVINEDLL